MDAPHGRGTLRSAPADGRTYTGAFEGGVPSGRGTMVISASGDAAEGEWAKGVLVEGVVRCGGGGEYEGELDEAMRPHGAGSLTDADGFTPREADANHRECK